MSNQWKDFLSDSKRAMLFVFLVMSGFVITSLFTRFMIWNEGRPGFTFDDPLIKCLHPVNLSRFTMSLTLIPIFIGMVLIFRKPAGAVYFFFGVIIICSLRTITLYLIPLEPPPGIIPLTDPVIEKLFYGNNVLLKDLFFSGHTANIVIIGLLSDSKLYRNFMFLCAGVVGLFLIWQHAHYSIDVIAAPFFALLAYKMCIFTGNKTLLKECTSFQCHGSISGRYQRLDKVT